MSAPTWMLVDGNNLIAKYFHAAGDGARGLFTAKMAKLQKRLKPRRSVVCFDSPTVRWRSRVDPQYKANRSATPEGLRVELSLARAWCRDNEIDVVCVEGFEADDCIATVTRLAIEQFDTRVVMVSSDKDLRQLLIAGRVSQLVELSSKTERWMTAAELVEEYGITAEQWVDFQTLVGDKSDNVIGADGIGEKTATQILRRCGTLEVYYANPWSAQITQRQMSAMARFRGRVAQVRQLVELRTDVPLPAGWAAEVVS